MFFLFRPLNKILPSSVVISFAANVLSISPSTPMQTNSLLFSFYLKSDTTLTTFFLLARAERL